MNTIFQEENYNKGNEANNSRNKAKPVISDIETIKLSLKMLSINQKNSNKNDNNNNNNNKFEIPSISSQYNYFDSSDNEDEKITQKSNRNPGGTARKEGYNKNLKKNGYKDYSNNPYTANTSYPLTESSNYNPNDYYNMINTPQQYNSPKKFNSYNYFKSSNDLTTSFDNYATSLYHQNQSQNQYCKYNQNDGTTTVLNFNNFNKNHNILKYSANNSSSNNNSMKNLYDSDFQVTSSNDYKNQKVNYKKKNEPGQNTSNKKFLNLNRSSDDHLGNLNFNPTRKDSTSKSLLFSDNSASRLSLDSFSKNDFTEKPDYPLTYNTNNSNLFFTNSYLSSKFSFNTSLNNILNNSLNIYNGESDMALTTHSLDPSSSSSLFYYSNNVFDKENSLINSLNYPSTNMSTSTTTTTTIQFPTRPGYGKNGKLISIKANFYPILSLPKFDIHHYEVTVEPETTSTKLQKIYQKWEEENQNTSLKNLNLIFDGKKNIYTSKPLPFTSQITSFYVEYADYYDKISEKSETQNDYTKKYKIVIKKMDNINMSSLIDFLNGKSKIVPTTTINALDILLRYHQSSIYTNIGKCFYTSEESTSISNGAQLWKGFYQSIHPTSGRMMINLDVSATAFYESGPVLEVVAHILGYSSSKDLTHSFSEHDRLRVEKTIKGIKVVITHRNEQKRKYKVSRVTYYSANNTMFPYGEDNTEISVTEYFKTRYNYKLKFAHLPCLIVGDPNRHIYLPMEVCEVAPAQRLCRKLNEKQTADMIRFTCQPPHKRSHKISNTMTILNKENSSHLKDFNIKIGSEMAVIKARILDPPLISYHPLSSEPEFLPVEGSWNLKDKKVAEGAILESWSVVVFGSENCFSLYQVKKFISQLINTCEETGVKVNMTQPPIFYANMQVDVQTTLWNAFYKAANMSYVRPQLILCILSNTGVPLYADIKRVGDTVIGISTQCIQGKHIMSIKRQYCANVCLKINAKLGGMNSYLSKHQLPFVNEEPTILFGANVTHPSSNNSNGLSIAAMVGTIDGYCSRYAATISIQTNHQEIIQNLTEMVKNLIQIYYQTTNQKPKRIIFYRDNAPDNQFKEIVQAEIEMIRKACQSMEINVVPKITYVMVQKRHHCRFFPIHKSDSDQYGNILPGTVVDTGIIHPNEFDFYLCSHPGLQGTSKPTHYHILLDENNFVPDTFQELTYRLCYLYCRATKSVSVCPPAYYAHLVAARARFHIYTPNNSNSNRNSKIFNKNNQNQFVKQQKGFYNSNSSLNCMNGINMDFNGNMNINSMNPNANLNMNSMNSSNNMTLNPMNMSLNGGNMNPNLNANINMINTNNGMMNSNMTMNLNSAMNTSTSNTTTNNGMNSSGSSTQNLYNYNFNSSSSIFSNYNNTTTMKNSMTLNENDFNKSTYQNLDFLNLNEINKSFMNTGVNLNSLSSNGNTANNSKNNSNVFLLNDSSIFNLNKFNSSIKTDLSKEVFEEKGIPVKMNTTSSNNNSFYVGENQQQPIGSSLKNNNNKKSSSSSDFMKAMDIGRSNNSSSATLQNPSSSTSSLNNMTTTNNLLSSKENSIATMSSNTTTTSNSKSSSTDNMNTVMDKTEKIYEPFSTSINDLYSSSLTNKMSQMSLNSNLTDSPLENYSISSLNKLSLYSNKFTSPSLSSQTKNMTSSNNSTTSNNNSNLNLNINSNSNNANNIINTNNNALNNANSLDINNTNKSNENNNTNSNDNDDSNTTNTDNNNFDNNNNNNNNNNLLTKLNNQLNNLNKVFNPLNFDSKSTTDFFNSNEKINLLANNYNNGINNSVLNNMNDMKLNFNINKNSNTTPFTNMVTMPSSSTILNDTMMNPLALKDGFTNFANINNNNTTTNNSNTNSNPMDLNNISKEKMNNSFMDNVNNNNINYPLEKIIQYGTVRPELERVMYFM